MNSFICVNYQAKTKEGARTLEMGFKTLLISSIKGQVMSSDFPSLRGKYRLVDVSISL